MNCPKCGMEMPEGATICPNCPTTPEKPLKKSQFIKEVATKGTKTVSKLTWLAFIICAALVIGGAYLALTTHIFDIPALDFAKDIIGSKDDIIEEFETFLKDDELYNYAKTSYEENIDELTAEEQALAETALDECVIFMDAPNLLNTRSFYISVLDCLEHDNPFSKAYAEEYDYADTLGEIVVLVLNIIICTVAGIAILSVIFLLISAKVKSVGLVVVTILLNAIVNVLLVGIVYAIVTAVLLIVMAFLAGAVNKAYKDYRQTFVK